ncbi:hypothetical protein BBO_08512 [Beauveria brongniartii RCEF 3172]|uniref:Uncharacterized protein n=1 Tax=Beauveria brongniartii RCEF 3172 TaxID=1081107 RepID=A0A166XIR4_9HYPO|nr:hypothetical protein BBO_08512 [Beauveria brongniartii RCEF 3172]
MEGKFGGVQLKFSAATAVRGVPMVGPDLGTFYDDCDVVAAVPDCSLALVDTQMLPKGHCYLYRVSDDAL